MSKCEEFLDFFDYLVENCKVPVELPNNVKEFYNLLREDEVLKKDKPLFTESGLEILEYLQNAEGKSLKAKDIADGMNASSRKISGAIRKLVTDGFVDKIPTTSPVLYTLTEKGKQFDLKNYKSSLENE